MQLELLNERTNADSLSAISVNQLQQLSRQAQGWIIIFSDQKVSKHTLLKLSINTQCVLQFNSDLLTRDSINKLSQHACCVVISEQLCQHPLVDLLTSTCLKNNISIMQAKLDKASGYSQEELSRLKKRQLQLAALKKELKDIFDVFNHELQAYA